MLSISCEIALRYMPQDLTDDKSKLVQIMAWCHQTQIIIPPSSMEVFHILFSSNNWNPPSATFYTTQGVPAELGLDLSYQPTSEAVFHVACYENVQNSNFWQFLILENLLLSLQ